MWADIRHVDRYFAPTRGEVISQMSRLRKTWWNGAEFQEGSKQAKEEKPEESA